MTSYGRPVRTIIDALRRSPDKNAALVVAPDIIRTLESITELPITMTMRAEMADSPPQGWLRFRGRKRWKEAAHLLPGPVRVLDGAYLTRKIAQRLRKAFGQKVESDGSIALSAVNVLATQAAWDVYHQTNAAADE